MSNKVYCIEDHDQALALWRQHRVRSATLVHIDAHFDFQPHDAQPPAEVLNRAKSVSELKRRLEYSLAYLHYQKDLSQQTTIGNYLYPAIVEGIVADLWWVIPGAPEDFAASRNELKEIARGFADTRAGCSTSETEGVLRFSILGRTATVCTLHSLPEFCEHVLLDIDTDFLTTRSLKEAENTARIGRRALWITPQQLSVLLKQKIKNSNLVTIAYSVNGGYTPMKYKYLGDELAGLLEGRKNRRRARNLEAGKYFTSFESTGKKRYYWQAVLRNASYRAADNNYGPLFLAKGKTHLARAEFKRMLAVDPRNPAAQAGLALTFLAEKKFAFAKDLFCSALAAKEEKIFRHIRREAVFGLAQAEFGLKNLAQAEKLLQAYRKQQPLEPYAYFLLGRICQRHKQYPRAAQYYQDAVRVGLNSIEPLQRLAKICVKLSEKKSIIQYIRIRTRELKRAAAVDIRRKDCTKRKRACSKRIMRKVSALEKIIDRST